MTVFIGLRAEATGDRVGVDALRVVGAAAVDAETGAPIEQPRRWELADAGDGTTPPSQGLTVAEFGASFTTWFNALALQLRVNRTFFEVTCYFPAEDVALINWALAAGGYPPVYNLGTEGWVSIADAYAYEDAALCAGVVAAAALPAFPRGVTAPEAYALRIAERHALIMRALRAPR
jgi:hypothetical protein